MNVIDLPAWVPKRPDGSINVEQLETEYRWRTNPSFAASTFGEYLAAIVEREHEPQRFTFAFKAVDA